MNGTTVPGVYAAGDCTGVLMLASVRRADPASHGLGVVIILPLLLAILVDRVTSPRVATFYRVVLLIPAVIPSTLIFVLWKWMYNYQVGPINHFLVETLGLFTLYDAPQWLGGTPLTLPAVAIMEVWWGLGYHTIFFLAGLAAIPKDLPEAARGMIWTDVFADEMVRDKLGLVRPDEVERARQLLLAHRFRDGAFSSCNIYALLTPRSLVGPKVFRTGGQFGKIVLEM